MSDWITLGIGVGVWLVVIAMGVAAIHLLCRADEPDGWPIHDIEATDLSALNEDPT